ncbi:TetR family transcriptional regulator [Paraburkholderia sp. CNPSo 3274]|uniref:TetR/AcrR family transcriptional regulator n=1 Tax=Paraburkholderia sp. CNPSo 3274 TaxID=2940932 RepID=UPI0020B8D997|nr:TetR/AcrR family transcriptional regulator [Paraburkholderia sp. CNPSo 3274]MCP3710502.1 TetR family transcriptional regulator [Paraburkholderia sp. CNPSo 3274]
MPSRNTRAASSPAADIKEPHASARSTTPERILDTAERLFAMHGYFGTSIRDIMQGCGMELSLARYHFGSKDALFQQAIGRRAAVISQQVIESLEAALAPLHAERPDVEAIVTALSAPAFAHLKSGDPGWQNYLRLLTQIGCLLERPDLTAPFYDQYAPAAARYRDAFAKALPRASRETVELVQHFVESVFHLVLNELYAKEARSGTRALTAQHIERMRTYLIRFAVGGIEAMVNSAPAQRGS